MSKNLSYDKENDILVIHKGFSSEEKFKGNIDVGDLILDISTTGRVRGIEILNATKFLREFKIGKRILECAIDGNFSATVKPGSIMLGITIKTEKEELPAKIAVPVEIGI